MLSAAADIPLPGATCPLSPVMAMEKSKRRPLTVWVAVVVLKSGGATRTHIHHIALSRQGYAAYFLFSQFTPSYMLALTAQGGDRMAHLPPFAKMNYSPSHLIGVAAFGASSSACPGISGIAAHGSTLPSIAHRQRCILAKPRPIRPGFAAKGASRRSCPSAVAGAQPQKSSPSACRGQDRSGIAPRSPVVPRLAFA